MNLNKAIIISFHFSFFMWCIHQFAFLQLYEIVRKTNWSFGPVFPSEASVPVLVVLFLLVHNQQLCQHKQRLCLHGAPPGSWLCSIRQPKLKALLQKSTNVLLTGVNCRYWAGMTPTVTAVMRQMANDKVLLAEITIPQTLTIVQSILKLQTGSNALFLARKVTIVSL